MGPVWRAARVVIAIVLAAVAFFLAVSGFGLMFRGHLEAGLFFSIVGVATAAGAYGVWPPRPRPAGSAPMQSYLDRTLNSGERIERSARLHWIVFARPATALVVGVLVAVASSSEQWRVFGILVAVLALIALVLAFIKWRTTEIAITNQRVLLKVGLIKRDTIEIIASKIESVDISQSVLGRLLNFGTVMVRGTGGNVNKIKDVPDPLEFRRAVARV